MRLGIRCYILPKYARSGLELLGAVAAATSFNSARRKKVAVRDVFFHGAIRRHGVPIVGAKRCARAASCRRVDQSTGGAREHPKGAHEKSKGAIKQTAGKMTGDKKLQSEGSKDKAKGDLHNVAGDMKDAVKDAL